jgi:hypothetical protein
VVATPFTPGLSVVAFVGGLAVALPLLARRPAAPPRQPSGNANVLLGSWRFGRENKLASEPHLEIHSSSTNP